MRTVTAIFSEGETIYSPFSTNREVFLVTVGYVFAYSLEADGKKRIHLIYGPGSYFPVITTFKKASQRASYEALTRVAVTKYDLREFVDEIGKNLEFSNLVLHKTVTQLGIFADIVINLHTAKLENKLLNLLHNLAHDHGIAQDNHYVLPYTLKHHHLADMLGAERESVSRSLQSLRKKQLIKTDANGHLVIMT